MQRLALDTLISALPLVPTFMGIYMIFRVREDFDLTIEASFTMGGAVTAALILHGAPVAVATLAAVLLAGCLGLVTTALHLTLRIPVILAGLVMSIAGFSVNLHILGQPSVNLLGVPTLFSGFDMLPSTQADLATIGVMFAISAGALAALALFLRTEVGLALRATGVNARMARSHGVNDRGMLALSLFTANLLSGLGGSMLVQEQGFADVNMGTGTLIAGIGAVLLGELLLRPGPSKIGRIVLAVLLGTILYRLVLVGALRLGLPAEDLKGATALTLVVAFAAQRYGTPLVRWLHTERAAGVSAASAAVGEGS